MRAYILAIPLLCVAGCASFTHQVAVSDPHALLTVLPHRLHPDEEAHRVITIDGHRVRSKRQPQSYRLTPGEHAIVIEDEVTVTRTNPYSGVEAILWLVGSFAMDSGGHTVHGQGPVSTYTETLRSSFTNNVTLGAGLSYTLDAYGVNQQTEKPNKPGGR